MARIVSVTNQYYSGLARVAGDFLAIQFRHTGCANSRSESHAGSPKAGFRAIMTEEIGKSLYDPAFERDSCGFGLIANIDDNESHWVVETAIAALARLTHRGAVAADGKTGDGCGLLMKFPRSFMRAVAKESGIELSDRFAAGTVFLNQDDTIANDVRKIINEALEQKGLGVAGWRKVPIDTSACGAKALDTLPVIEQVFVNAKPGMTRNSFNRQLFLARRCAENQFAEIDPVAYVASLSSATLSCD